MHVDSHPVVQRHFHYLGVRVPDPWTSAALAFAMSACLLAASAADLKYGILGFFALFGLLALLYPHFTLKANTRNAILWLYPAWTVLSIAWSIDPDRTFHSVQLLLPTIAAALAMGALPDRRAVTAGAALALVGYISYSLVYGSAFRGGADGESMFAGITSSKNYFGHLSAMSMLMSLSFVTFLSVEKGRLIVTLAAIGGGISAIALLDSRATGSLLAGITGIGVFVGVIIFPRLGWPFKLMMLTALIGAIILYVTFGTEIEEYLFTLILQKFNKDPTLTGRQTLWDFADALIKQKPFLGHGFNAFWYWTNPDAWTLWRSMGVAPMSGFNFHNLPREILIDGGAIGLALFAVSVGYTFVRTLLRGLLTGDPVLAVQIAFICYFLMRMGVETTGFAAVTIDTLLLFGFLCLPVDAKAVQESLAPTPQSRFVFPEDPLRA